MQLLVSFFLNVRFQGTGRDMANLKCGSTMEEPSNSDRQCCRLESWVSDINRRPISPLFSLFQLLNNTFSPLYLQHQGTFLQDLRHIHLLLEVITRLHLQLIHHHRDRCMGSYQLKRFQMLHQVSVPWYSSKSMGDSQETIGEEKPSCGKTLLFTF